MTRKDKFLAFTFLIFSFYIFYPQYVSNKIIAWLDIPYYFYPFRTLVAELVRKNILPLWNPYIYCGTPLMANMQSAVFYPLDIFFYILPFDIALKILTYFSFCLMSYSTYSFLRLLKFSEEASYVATLSFVFTFYITIKAADLADFNVLIWMPSVLYFTQKYIINSRIWDAFLSAIMLAIAFLGGHPQVFSYVYLFFLLVYFSNISFKKIILQQHIKNYILINLILIFIILVQLVPTIEFIKLSKRLGEGIDFITSKNSFMKPEQLILAIFPPSIVFMTKTIIFSNWYTLIEISVLPLFLFFLSFFKAWEKRNGKFIIILFILSFLISYMGNLPFYNYIYNILPIFKIINYPGKFNIILFFAICLLIATGYEYLFNLEMKESKKFRYFILFYVSIFLIFYLLCCIFKNNFLEFIIKNFNKTLNLAGPNDVLEVYKAFMHNFLIYLLLIICSYLLILIVLSKKIIKVAIHIIVIIFIVINIFYYHIGGFKIYLNSNILNKNPVNIELLLNDKEIKNRRIIALRYLNTVNFEIKSNNLDSEFNHILNNLNPNIGMENHLLNAEGSDSLIINNFALLKERIFMFKNFYDIPAFDLLNIKFIISKYKLYSNNLKPFTSFDTNIYEYNKPTNIVVFIPANKSKILFEENNNSILNEILSSKYNIKNTIVFNKCDKNIIIGFKNLKENFIKKDYSNIKYNLINSNNFEINIKTNKNGFILLLDNYYPGWNVYVDGLEQRLLKTNLTFKSVFIRAGKHQIRFIFKPLSFYLCILISLFFILINAIYGILFLTKMKLK